MKLTASMRSAMHRFALNREAVLTANINTSYGLIDRKLAQWAHAGKTIKLAPNGAKWLDDQNKRN